ncbi:MAG: hypothetical protein ACRD4F_09275 [Candidatus Angelobacter sp.]
MLFSIALLAQTVVDATVPIHKRLRNPTAGQSGSIGRKLPIQVALEFPSEKSNSDGDVKLVFVLTNVGHQDLIIPISPHPGDFEPPDQNQPYTVQHLHLYLTSTKVQDSALPGGADLFGNESHPTTLLALAPGKSVRVLAWAKMPKELAPEPSTAASIFAHAVLDLEALKTVRGQTISNSDEIGSSSSPGYKLKLP